MRWPWRRRRRQPSAEAERARTYAEDASRRSAGLLQQMQAEIAELREHQHANHFDRILIEAYTKRRPRHP